LQLHTYSPPEIEEREQKAINIPERGHSVRRGRSNIKGLLRIGVFLLLTSLILAISLVISPLVQDLGSWGYVGAFIINAVSSATVILPSAGIAATLVMARDFDPILLGIAAGLGGTIGELTAYALGHYSRKPLEKIRANRYADWAMEHFCGGVLFAFALLPILPADVAGIIAGATNYPLRKFLLYVGIAKVIAMVVLMVVASGAWSWAGPWIGRID